MRCIPVNRASFSQTGKPDCTSAFPRCAGQLVAKAKKRAAAKVRGVGRVGTGKTKGGARSMVRTCMLTPLIDGLGRATWSSTMPVTRSRTPVVLAKSLVYFSSACCTGAFGIALMPLRFLQCENKRRQTHTHRPSTEPSLCMRAEG